MKPALTAEEWAHVKPITDYEDASQRADEIEESVNGMERPNFHKAAALALFHQPFGFTHRDVDALREASIVGRVVTDGPDPELWSLAERIEALLPPEG